MLKKPQFSLRLMCLVATFFAIAGCGGDLKVAPVSGTVTLDGTPLDRASVLFQPDQGRPSFGITDRNGKYTLNYSMHQTGAEVGSCKVKITTALQAEDDDNQKASKAAEKVPKRYAKEPITVTVQSKSNTINIALTSNP